jgi:predicted nucleic acid-binding protein
MIVVADTTPLNYLVLIGQIELLSPLYQSVLIPLEVHRELQRPRHRPLFVRGRPVSRHGAQCARFPPLLMPL